MAKGAPDPKSNRARWLCAGRVQLPVSTARGTMTAVPGGLQSRRAGRIRVVRTVGSSQPIGGRPEVRVGTEKQFSARSRRSLLEKRAASGYCRLDVAPWADRGGARPRSSLAGLSAIATPATPRSGRRAGGGLSRAPRWPAVHDRVSEHDDFAWERLMYEPRGRTGSTFRSPR